MLNKVLAKSKCMISFSNLQLKLEAIDLINIYFNSPHF